MRGRRSYLFAQAIPHLISLTKIPMINQNYALVQLACTDYLIIHFSIEEARSY